MSTTTSLPIPQFGHLPAGLKALAADPHVFVQEKRLMEVLYSPKVHLAPMTYGHLLERLNRSHHWHCVVGRDHRPPPGFESQFLLRGEWPGVKSIAGIVDTPVLRPDGTLLDTPGYDEATGLFYAPATTFHLPAQPNQDQARRAVAQLRRRFDSLPFETDAHRSAFLAALLTPFARPGFEGAAPLCFFDAPNDATPTLLADAVSLLATGRRITQLEKPHSERAFRRCLARAQVDRDHLMLLNGAETYRSAAALRTALFSRGWHDGRERTRDPRPITWFAASANALLTSSVAALVLPIHLDATEDDATGASWAPAPDFESRLLRDRAELVSAALTILRAYEVAGRPAQDLPSWPGFEAWSDRVAAALTWAGATSPLNALPSAAASIDDDLPDVTELFNGLARLTTSTHGLTVHELIARLAREEDGTRPLRAALDALIPGGWSSPRRLGALLKKHRRRVIEGWALDIAGASSTNHARWLIHRRDETSGLGARSVPAATSDIETSTDSGPPERRDLLPRIQHIAQDEHADRPGPRSVSAAASDIETSTDSDRSNEEIALNAEPTPERPAPPFESAPAYEAPSQPTHSVPS